MLRHVWPCRIIVASLLVLMGVLSFVPASSAAPLVLTLSRTTLTTNVPDAAGVSSYDGGWVEMGIAIVGQYARVVRSMTGFTNSTVTITIFLQGQDPQSNLTLQGAHTAAGETGSITGASAISGAVGLPWTVRGATLTINP